MTLTPKQAAFVREYLVDRNGAQAAIRAGYSRKAARQQGSRLLAHGDVREAVDKAQAKLAEVTEVDAAWVLRKLTHEAQIADHAASRIRATELIGKHIGMFVERREQGGPGEFANLTEDELEDRVEEKVRRLKRVG